MTAGQACRIEWCKHPADKPLSYGDGVEYHACRVGHVTPQPPPPDLYAIDDLADSDD